MGPGIGPGGIPIGMGMNGAGGIIGLPGIPIAGGAIGKKGAEPNAGFG